MSSSSSPARVLRGEASVDAAGLEMPDLRTGGWTRWGDQAVLGDHTTELVLDRLAERAHAAARAQGYATGWAEGRREAQAAVRQTLDDAEERAAAEESRREAEHAAAVSALLEAADQLRTGLAQVSRETEALASSLALELTRELVGRAAAEAGEHALARVNALLPDTEVLKVRLHPSVVPAAAELRAHGVPVVADPDLGPADALVEADDHVVDLRIDTALERLREVLG